MLRVWQNDALRIDGVLHVRLTHHAAFAGREDNLGYQERLQQLAQAREGAACFMVMCEPRDATEVPRVIKSFNERELFVASDLIDHDGDVWAPIASRQRV